MSKATKIMISCPHCKKQISATIWTSVNTDLRDNIPQQIIDGSFFNEVCPECNNTVPLRYSVLYNDLKHRKMVWAIYPTDSDYDKKIKQITKGTIYTGYTRLVDSIDDLREVVCAIEAGRDDRIIELYKALAYCEALNEGDEASDPTHPIRYLRINGVETFLFATKTGEEKYALLDESLYDTLNSVYSSKLPNDRASSFPKYDLSWALDFITKNSDDISESTAVSDKAAHNEPFFCKKCGRKVASDSIYCNYCGTNLSCAGNCKKSDHLSANNSPNTSQAIFNKNNSSRTQILKRRFLSFMDVLAKIVLSIALLVVSVIVVLSLLSILNRCSPSPSYNAPHPPNTTQATETYPTQTAYNGQILKKPYAECVAPLSISTTGPQDYYVYLESVTGANDIAFYVEGGKTVDISVPLGTYAIYYATGSTWYGRTHLFGDNTGRYRCEGKFEFYFDGKYYQGWTLELYDQINGNMDTFTVSESEFPG